MLIKSDALLTVTELSLPTDEALSTLYSFPPNLNHLPILPEITDLARCLHAVVAEIEIHKEPTVPYRSVNPATGEVLQPFPQHTDEQMWSVQTGFRRLSCDQSAAPREGENKHRFDVATA